MTPPLALYLAFLLIACLATFVATPFLLNRLRQRGITGKDINKKNQPDIPEMGGIAIWMGFCLAILVGIFAQTYLHAIEFSFGHLMAGTLTILIVGFIGVVDDLIGWRRGLRQYQHALLPVFAALPLMAIKITNSPFALPLVGALPAQFAIPLVGTVSFGLLYSLVFVPIGVTGASNATNMLAGLNGLEAGLGILIMATLLGISATNGMVEAALIAAAIMGALIGFIIYNWHPAKVFGGDSLTLMVGAGIATVSILGNMEKIGVMLMALYFIELVLKARTRFQGESFGEPQNDGSLAAPKKTQSLTHVVMRTGRLREDQVVLRLLALQALVCAAVVLTYYLNQIRVIDF